MRVVVKKIVLVVLSFIFLGIASLYIYKHLSRTPIVIDTSNWPIQENVKAVKRGNVTLWTEHFGNPQDPPVLLLHGAGSRSVTFPKWFIDTLLDANYFVIRYDQRDSGYSTHFWQAPPNCHGPYEAQDLFDDAWAVLDAYNIERAHYIGYSMGGYLVSAMLYEKPERALSSVIIAAGVAECRKVRKKLGISFRTEETNKHLSSAQPTGDLKKDLPMWQKYYSYMHGCYRINLNRFKEFVKSSYIRNKRDLKTPWNHISAIRGFPDHHMEHLKTITTSCLVIHGSDDKMVPTDNGEKLAELIPTAKFVLLPNVGHHLFNKAIWDKIGKEILTFFLNTN